MTGDTKRTESGTAPTAGHGPVERPVGRPVEQGDGIRGPDVQGFLDSAGRFLRRAEAYTLAEWNGQLQRRPGGYQGTDLYSEDVW